MDKLPKEEATEEIVSSHRVWSPRDIVVLCLLLAWGIAYYFPGLGELEFFRHTEADRTLIAWAMAESGNYLVPELLNSLILTKPPLYYWASALSINYFGQVNEFVARVPSAVAMLLLVVVQFLVARRVGYSTRTAGVSALVLGTSAGYWFQALLAEIDMLFSFFVACSLYGLFFFERDRKRVDLLICYLFAALAFLTKGPPIIFFLGATLFLFVAWNWVKSGFKISRPGIKSGTGAHAVGLAIFVLVLSAWLIPLVSKVGGDLLWRELKLEVLNRVTAESSRDRGPLFYIPTLFSMLAQWSPFFLLGLLVPVYRSRAFWLEQSDRVKSFYAFNLICLSASFLMLSIAEGKADRYLLPVLFTATNIACFGLAFFVRSAELLKFGRRMIRPLFYLSVAVIAALPVCLFLDGVKVYHLLLVAGAASVVVWGFYRSFETLNLPTLVLLLIGLTLTARLSVVAIYAPHRNEVRSVRPLAWQVASALSSDKHAYSLEMYERWVVFYLKQLGVEVTRLTPELVNELQAQGEPIKLLLSTKEEEWRIGHFKKHGVAYKLLGTYSGPKDELMLIELAAEDLPILRPRDRFPTDSLEPFTD